MVNPKRDEILTTVDLDL